MNESKLQIDDFVLDELVTGNLSHEQYREVLFTLEAKPHLWRKCAYAFLQEQALAKDLKSLSQGDIDWSAGSGNVRQLQHATSVAADSAANHQSASSHRQRMALQRFAALAALLLVSFSIGWMGAGLRDGTSAAPGRPVSEAGVLGALGQHNPVTAVPAATPVGGQSTPLQFNMQNPGMLLANDGLLPIDLQIPASLRKLERDGKVRIETIDAIMPVELPDGTSAIVPVQQFRVVPVLYSY